MTNCISLPWDISLQQRALHKLAELFWGTFVLEELVDQKDISIESKTEMLLMHRDKILKYLPQLLSDIYKRFSATFPKLLMNKMINSVFNLQQGYYEALVWENRYRYFLQLNIFNPVTAGKYHPTNFIEPTGHFNDLALVKLFVIDERMDAICRFRMACLYCLENAVFGIRNSLKSEGKELAVSPCSKISDIGANFVILFWACFRFNSSEFTERITETYIYFLKAAVSGGNEYAARFLWKSLSVSEKQNFLMNFKYELIVYAAQENISGVVHFLYLLLSQEHKNALIFMKNLPRLEDMGKIWYCLLDSQYYKCTLNDILNFPESIPMSVYYEIFSSLTLNIGKFNYPIQKIIFKTLWNHLSRDEQNRVFQETGHMIATFVKLKEIDLLETIIKNLSFSLKEKNLLYSWKDAGASALIELSKFNNYDTVLRYLMIFLLDEDSSTNKLRLNVNSSGILKKLTENIGANYSGVDDLAVQQILGKLRECLHLLNGVLNKISETHLFDL